MVVLYYTVLHVTKKDWSWLVIPEKRGKEGNEENWIETTQVCTFKNNYSSFCFSVLHVFNVSLQTINCAHFWWQQYQVDIWIYRSHSNDYILNGIKCEKLIKL